MSGVPCVSCGVEVRLCDHAATALLQPILSFHNGEVEQLQADLVAAREREQRLMTRLRCAERNTLYQDTDLDWCRICDQTAPTDQRIDHAPDCPFAAAAPSAVAQEPRGEGV